MRIVVVEDEPRTRDGLINMIERYTKNEICGIAANGIEGLRLIREMKPDLVITDIQMPEMDGLAMLQELEREEPGSGRHALILTGYSSFDYARTALHLGVVDYVLKPIEVEGFVSLLLETEAKISREKSEKISDAQLLWSCVASEPEKKPALLRQLSERLHLDAETEITLYLVRLDQLEPDAAGRMMQEIRDRADDCCRSKVCVTHQPLANGILVLVGEADRNGILTRMFADKVLPFLKKAGGCCSSRTSIVGLEGLEEAIAELTSLLPFVFSYGSDVVLDRQMVDRLQFSPICYPVDLDNRIRKEIMAGDYEKALRTARRFQEMVIESDGKPELIREYTARFASSAYNVAKEYGSSSEPLLIYHFFINHIIESRTKDDLVRNYEMIMNTLLGGRNIEADVDNLSVLKVINYIRDNYGSNVTLSEAAELIGVTPEYLSKLFFQKINVNFTVFLRNFRISEAKRMILTGKYRIQEIAEHVGFNDPKYFNKVFKSVCGVTPSEFKKVI